MFLSMRADEDKSMDRQKKRKRKLMGSEEFSLNE